MKKNIVIVGILGIIIIFIASYFFWSQSSYRIDISRSAVITELKELNRLETAAFTIEKIIDAQTATSGQIQQFLFGDRLLLIAHGEVIAGIDLSKLQENDINIQEKNIDIKLPAAEILVVSIDNTKSKVYDRRTGILAKGDKDLEAEARKEAEQSIRQAACEGGILDEATENARRQLTALFRTLAFEQITITIPSSPCL